MEFGCADIPSFCCKRMVCFGHSQVGSLSFPDLAVVSFGGETTWSVPLPKTQQVADAIRPYHQDGDGAWLNALSE